MVHCAACRLLEVEEHLRWSARAQDALNAGTDAQAIGVAAIGQHDRRDAVAQTAFEQATAAHQHPGHLPADERVGQQPRGGIVLQSHI
jgi:hypothetical protein